MKGPVAVLAALAIVATLGVVGRADAHATGLSRGEYVVSGAQVTTRLTFARGELIGLLPTLDANHDKAIDAAELSAGQVALATIPARVSLVATHGPCSPKVTGSRLEEEDGITVDAVYTCPQTVTGLTVNVALLDDLAPGHRHIGVVSGLGTPRDFIAFAKQPSVSVGVPPKGAGDGASPPSEKRSESFGGFFRLGIEHILTGYDHLLFLFALLLVGGRLRSLLAVITAFTVAHSLTLGLAALGLFTLSPSVVEPAIALSIAYVGVENFFVKSADRRYLLTFPFGLIHGFGFAGALSEIALPRAQVPSALLAFNLGVESGQLAVVAVVLPLLLLLRKKTWFLDYGVKALSGLVVIAGVVWFVQRVFFV